jgi:hypothetical protein
MLLAPKNKQNDSYSEACSNINKDNPQTMQFYDSLPESFKEYAQSAACNLSYEQNDDGSFKNCSTNGKIIGPCSAKENNNNCTLHPCKGSLAEYGCSDIKLKPGALPELMGAKCAFSYQRDRDSNTHYCVAKDQNNSHWEPTVSGSEFSMCEASNFSCLELHS